MQAQIRLLLKEQFREPYMYEAARTVSTLFVCLCLSVRKIRKIKVNAIFEMFDFLEILW